MANAVRSISYRFHYARGIVYSTAVVAPVGGQSAAPSTAVAVFPPLVLIVSFANPSHASTVEWRRNDDPPRREDASPVSTDNRRYGRINSINSTPTRRYNHNSCSQQPGRINSISTAHPSLPPKQLLSAAGATAAWSDKATKAAGITDTTRIAN